MSNGLNVVHTHCGLGESVAGVTSRSYCSSMPLLKYTRGGPSIFLDPNIQKNPCCVSSQLTGTIQAVRTISKRSKYRK